MNPAIDPKERFSSRVADYVLHRPGYPAAVLDVLGREIGFDFRWTVADIGSGTGISARLFLEHGNPVFAVEPNPAMRTAAEAWLRGREGFVSVDGSAEATGLAPASVDIVVAAQAFHWFSLPETSRELLRILRPPGWVALLWNVRHLDGSEFLRGYESLLLRFGTDYSTVRHERAEAALGDFFGGALTRRVVANEQRFDQPGLRGRLLSSSYAPPPGHPDHEPMLDALDGLFERHQEGGRVRMTYDTVIYVGRVTPR